MYGLTDADRRELVDWLAELLSVPGKEYLRFEAGLSYLPVLEPADAGRLLAVRCQRLGGELTQRRAVRQHIADMGVPRVFVVEHEYMTALLEAELAWTEGLRADIESGALDGMELWNGFHHPHEASLGTAPSA